MAYLGKHPVLTLDGGAKANGSGKARWIDGVIGSAINTTLGLASGVALGLFLLTYGATEAVAMVLANLF